MTSLTTPIERGFKGPSLKDKVLQLLQQHGYNGPKCQRDFGVGPTWYSDVFLRHRNEPSYVKLQEIYEALTGEPLIK